MSTSTSTSTSIPDDELKFLMPKVIVKYLKKHKKRGVSTMWMFINKSMSYGDVNLNKIRSIGNKYSVLLKLRNHILRSSYYATDCNTDLFNRNSYNYSYYKEEKDEVIRSYLEDDFFNPSDHSPFKMVKVPKKLTYV